MIGTWEGDMNSFSANILNGVAKMVSVYRDNLDNETFKMRLGAVSIKTLSRTAKERRPGSLGFAEAMVIEYNGKKKSDTNKLPLGMLYTRESSLLCGLDTDEMFPENSQAEMIENEMDDDEDEYMDVI